MPKAMLTRFYASVFPLRLECPRCGKLIIARKPNSKRNPWNPHLSRLTCSTCSRAYTVGLLVWDTAGRQNNKRPPPDTIPSRAILGELRSHLGGFWARVPLKSGGYVHRFVKAECTCAPAPWKPSCLVHGLNNDVEEEYEPDGEPEPGTPRHQGWIHGRPPNKERKP